MEKNDIFNEIYKLAFLHNEYIQQLNTNLDAKEGSIILSGPFKL